ncbi:Uncharacterised protein [Slackia heliotrinireducens]|uniref:RRN7-type domain-containing protein n=1 Tax=Slackia heliotrinireducens (strain ATCC 29202 / DSM 20476 / NCTC 11029 / RHS 1) TaxID=471855 RepID=C7N296_SLAHD|nr:leucine-rich repeat protein [Slackia heliotrinireducens]ACV21402.1 hypothetical protein Shel_03360 [Slackia heliotrinireducens DSM 20476]VEG98838.1 Uncharacterised protein [Slackia heliotrinireducens]
MTLEIACELCGSNQLTRNADGTYQCDRCGTKYTLEAARQLMKGGAFRNNSADFVVEGGTLVRYTGADLNVVVPDGVITIGSRAFENTSIQSIVLPEGLVAIEGGSYNSSSFMRCRFLKSVRFPKSLEKIGKYAFCRCDALEQIEFCGEPAMAESFVDCPRLRTVRYASRVFIVPKFREDLSLGLGLSFDKDAPVKSNYQFDAIYVNGEKNHRL